MDIIQHESALSKSTPAGELDLEAEKAKLRAEREAQATPSDVEADFYHHPTNFAAARVFLKNNEGRYIFERIDARGNGEFYENMGSYFEPVHDIRVRITKALEDSIAKCHEYFLKINKPKEVYAASAKAISKAQARDFSGGVAAYFGELVTVKPKWNETPETLCCEDFLLDYSGSELGTRLPRENEYFRNPLPYSALNVLAAGEPEQYTRFLTSLFTNPATLEMARMIFAGSLSGRGPKSFVIHANHFGNNGKNTLFDLFREIFPGMVVNGSSATIAVHGDSSERRFDMARWEGKRVVVFDEFTPELDTSAIKYISSGSFIRGEAKGRNATEFRQTWIAHLLTNGPPKFRPADDSATLSRLLKLPYTSVFYESEAQKAALLSRGVPEDKLHPARTQEEIFTVLRPEFPAIVGQIARDAITLREIFRNKIPESQEAVDDRAAYVSRNDIVEGFIRNHLTVGEFESITNSELLDSWIDATGDEKSTSAKVGAMIRERLPNVKTFKSNGIRGLRGVGLKDENE